MVIARAPSQERRTRGRRGHDRTVATLDGGRLGVTSYGDLDAPGERRVLVVGGAFITALIYRPFALRLSQALGAGWAVDVFDRRGRGKSSEQPPNYAMATEIADVAAVLRETGARNLFGHSLGGAVVLNAVQAFQGLDGDGTSVDPDLVPDRLAVYDPAINIEGSLNASWMRECVRQIEAGHPGRALAVMHRGQQRTATLSRVPAPLLAGLLAAATRTPFGRAARKLVTSGTGELLAALEEVESVEDFAGLPTNTRFMAGARSASYFQETARQLHAAVRGSTYTESPDGLHGSVPAAVTELVDDIAAYFRD